MKSDDQEKDWGQDPDTEFDDTSVDDVSQEDMIDDSEQGRTITWTAKEYIHSDRSPTWFVIFAIIIISLIAVDIFLLKSYTFSGLVIVMTVALIIYTRRPPRTLTYGLSSNQGLYVGEKLYHFDDFKAFGVIKDGPHHSIMLIPIKRFSPGVSVYFPDESGEEIVDILGQQLPMEDLKLDIIDIVVRKLRL
ncbi:MAG: hypothetical protein WAO28_02925 [Candidatus Microsaccharimonas sp.]